MNLDETTSLLRNRSALTSQPYSAGVAELWQAALCDWSYRECRAALLAAARADRKVSVAQVIDHLPKRSAPPALPPVHCELCDGTGTRPAHSDHCTGTPERDCGGCAAIACRCTVGQTMAPVLERIVNAPDRPVRR
jgi:hypothetical protein